MPKRDAAAKAKGREALRKYPGLKRKVDFFLAIINDGRAALPVNEFLLHGGGLFDGHRFPTHATVVRYLREVAGVIASASRDNYDLQVDEPGFSAEFEVLRKGNPRYPYPPSSEEESRVRTHVVNLADYIVHGFMLDRRFQGYRCFVRCHCGRYFIAPDDRKANCRTSCRPSREPARKADAVRRHRARK